MKTLRRALILVLIVLAIAVVGFAVWASSGPGPLPEALAALDSDAVVTVTVGDWYAFAPADAEPTTGLVLYPGGRVDARAYAPFARDIAAEGFLVVIAPMPLNLAILDASAADRVMAAYPQIEAWAVGGHSLGGAMAAQYADANPDAVEGLVLWAAFPAAASSLADDELAVTSIYGSNDGLATPDEIEAARSLLPADAVYVELEGGNHAGFGRYGPQAGDNPASLAPEAQQAQTVEATVALLREISPPSAAD